jgi:5-formyltetrahydrofolate cyclo-ligase
MVSKGEIRQRALKARRSLAPKELIELSAKVEKNLVSLPEFKKARTIATYVSKDDEVRTNSVIERAWGLGKRVVVPRVNHPRKGLQFFEVNSWEEFSSGSFGVLEPTPQEGSGPAAIPLNSCDIVIVPLVAWDELGNRVGYGKGFFDAELRSAGSPFSIGLGLEVQRVETVPVTRWDAPLDMIVTEARILRFRKGRSPKASH